MTDKMAYFPYYENIMVRKFEPSLSFSYTSWIKSFGTNITDETTVFTYNEEYLCSEIRI